MTTFQQHLQVERREGVAVIRLNRPERLNVLGMGPGSSREELLHALVDAERDDNRRPRRNLPTHRFAG